MIVKILIYTKQEALLVIITTIIMRARREIIVIKVENKEYSDHHAGFMCCDVFDESVLSYFLTTE